MIVYVVEEIDRMGENIPRFLGVFENEASALNFARDLIHKTGGECLIGECIVGQPGYIRCFSVSAFAYRQSS